MLRRIPARSEQTPFPKKLTPHYPLFALAGRYAAELWIQSASLSMGEWRDLRFRNLIAGDTVFPNAIIAGLKEPLDKVEGFFRGADFEMLDCKLFL